MKNPFAVQTPESITAKDVIELFVDVFTDFYHVPKPGHTFINGPRGSGKSMMFRFMLPDCQSLHLKRNFNELDYFAIYVPIKKTNFNIVDLERLHKHANYLLNEHLMSLYIAIQAFKTISKLPIKQDAELIQKIDHYYAEVFFPSVETSGVAIPSLPEQHNKFEIYMSHMIKVCETFYSDAVKYVQRLSFSPDAVPYSGPICSYLDFLFPILLGLKTFSFIPKDKPIFLLIDDADNLNLPQTMILNTWVSYRTSADVSLKISTQLNYRTYKTIIGSLIDAPHDYSEVNTGTIYTSSKDKYLERVTAIIEKRLKNCGINRPASEFFPENPEQRKRLSDLYDQIKAKFSTEGKGYRDTDDAYRYALPEYIKSLQGPSKSGPTYSYSGYKQLVHISSGIIRYFLEASSMMFGEMLALNPTSKIEYISHSVQNDKIREYSNIFMFSEFDKLAKEEEEDKQGDSLTKCEKLRNLIHALGGLFHTILVSNCSERRVFSIAFSDTPSKEVLEIISLGVRFGYLQESSIGNKESTGRTKLYILNRRLAPFFLLDPTGFSGYKFIMSGVLRDALYKPQTFIRKLSAKMKTDSSLDEALVQKDLFSDT